MPQRTRKFIGTVFLLMLLIGYAAVAMTVGAAVVRDAPGWAQGLFFLTVGIGWALPAMPLIRWMQKPDPVEPG
jgi:hypothetical protein